MAAVAYRYYKTGQIPNPDTVFDNNAKLSADATTTL